MTEEKSSETEELELRVEKSDFNSKEDQNKNIENEERNTSLVDEASNNTKQNSIGENEKSQNILKTCKPEVEDDNAVDLNIDSQTKQKVEDDPNFAVICSFLEIFGESLEIEYSIKNLKTMFEDSDKVRSDLTDLHIKLLRKRRKYINKEKWEAALVKFCFDYSNVDAWELERFGYKNVSLSLRLRIFVHLLEAMFDHNPKFKADLNNSSNEVSSLRVPLFGRDITGFTYWYQIDSNLNFRLYKEQPDEENSWSLVSKNLFELNQCIQELETKKVESFKCISTFHSEESISNHASLLNKVEEKKEIEIKINKENIKDEILNEENFSNDRFSKNISNQCLKTENDTKFSIFDETSNYEKFQLPKIPENVDEKEENLQVQHENGSLSIMVNEIIDFVQSEENIENEIQNLSSFLLDQVENSFSSEKAIESSKKTKTSKKNKRRSLSKKKKSVSKSKPQNDEEKENDKFELQEPKETQSKKEKSPKPQTKKRRTEIDKLREDLAEGMTLKRSSRRIQALQEKKLIEIQEEQKRLEKEMREKQRKKAAASAAKAAAALASSLACNRSNDSIDDKKSKKKRKKKIESDEDFQNDSDEEEEQQLTKKKKRRRGKKRKKGINPWEDSEDSDEEKNYQAEEDYEDLDLLEDENEEFKFDENDNEDEFACEEIDPNSEQVVVRQARTVKKNSDNGTEQVFNDDKPCGKCGKYDNPEWILLCDKCDDGYHTSCLRPPLFLIPTGDWFCPPCEHKILLEKLHTEYERLKNESEKKDLEKKKQIKRWKHGHCEISSGNIMKLKEASNFLIHEKTDNLTDDDEIILQHHRKKRKNKLHNGYFIDEIEECLEKEDSNLSIDNQNDSEEFDNLSEKSSDESDEIGKLAFNRDSDEVRSNYKKKRKKRFYDINDYSRSGLKLRSARKRKPISYLFKEYDDLIKSAIFEEDEAEIGEEDEEEHDNSDLACQPRSKGKDISNILKANSELPDFSINPFENESSVNVVKIETEIDLKKSINESNHQNSKEKVEFSDDETSDLEKQEIRSGSKNESSKKQQKKKRLTNLDFSTDEEEDHASDEDFRMGDDDEELTEEMTEVEDENGDDDTLSDSDVGYNSKRRPSLKFRKNYSTRKSSRKRTKNRRFILDSDEEEEEDDEEASSEEVHGSYYSDSGSDFAPRTRRAASKKRFNYCEDTSTDEDVVVEKTNKRKSYEKDDDYFDDDDNEEEDNKNSNSQTNKNSELSEEENSTPSNVGTSKSVNTSIDIQSNISIKNQSHKTIGSPSSKEKIVDTVEKPIKPVITVKPVISNSSIHSTISESIVDNVQPSSLAAKSKSEHSSLSSAHHRHTASSFVSDSKSFGSSIKPSDSKPEYNSSVTSSLNQQPLAPPINSFPPSPTSTHYSVSNHPYHPPSGPALPNSIPPYTGNPIVPYNLSQPTHSHYIIPPRQHSLATNVNRPVTPHASFSSQIPPYSNQHSYRAPLPYQQIPSYSTSTVPLHLRPSEKSEESYTLTNLDSYESSPLKKPPPEYPPSYGPNYNNQTATPVPSSDSPPQILNLDSGVNNFNYQTTQPSKPPTNYYPPNPGLRHPSNYPYTAPPPPYMADRGPVYPPYAAGPVAPQHPPVRHHTQIHGLSPYPPGPYQPHPSHAQHILPLNPRNSSLSQSQPPSFLPTSNVAANIHLPSNNPVSSLHPPAQPHAPSLNYYYPTMQGHPSQASNVRFTIQNILHNPTNEPVCAVKSTPKATKSSPKPAGNKSKATKDKNLSSIDVKTFSDSLSQNSSKVNKCKNKKVNAPKVKKTVS